MPRRPIRAVIWDLILVAVFYDKRKDWPDHWGTVPRLRRYFETHSYGDAKMAITEVQQRFETGTIKTADSHRLELSKTFGLRRPLTWAEYRLGFITSVGYALNAQLIETQARLAKAGFRQALLSNLSPVVHDLVSGAGALRHHDVQLVSYVEGLMKPSAELLVRSFDRLCCAAEDAIFVDDSKRNIGIIRKERLGCRGHLFEDNAGLAKALLRGGIPEHCVAPLLEKERYVPIVTKWKPPMAED